MNKDTHLVYEPASAVHPGETIVEYLEFNNWSQRDLARRTGLTPKTISEICNGKAPVTPQTSLALEKVFRRPAHFWLSLQRRFDEAEARQRAAAKLAEWKEWAAKFPLREMKRYGWIGEGSKASDVDALLSFFGVSSPDSWNAVWAANSVAFRQTRKFRTTVEAVAAWVRETEIAAAEVETQIEIKDYDEHQLRASMHELRRQTRRRLEEWFPEVQALCAAAGVILVLVRELPNTGISGCARWLTDKKALVGLTLRYKTDDQIWFTLFHEMAHILLHKKEYTFILDNAAETLTDQVVDPQMQKNEEEANRFAADTLIPPEALAVFINNGDFSGDAIHGIADELGIGPGIVVGRLQHDGLLKRHEGNKLKQYFEGG
jgi:HTH-type transcriptional regulator / antitoxin HigA